MDFGRSFSLVLIGLVLGGCSLNSFRVDDPTTVAGIGPKPSDVVKSLRCEIITFLLENRLRGKLGGEFQTALQAGKLKDPAVFLANVEFLKSHPFVNIDPNQLAAVIVDFKNTNSFNVNAGVDSKTIPSKKVGKTGDFRDFGFGPSYSDTGTFELVQPFGIDQSADLGPQVPVNGGPLDHPGLKFSSIYGLQNAVDADFYCYKSLHNLKSSTLREVTADIQHLVQADKGWEDYQNFNRIHVGLNDTTLAKWLQEITADVAVNNKTISLTSESVYVGQLVYNFTLDVKPGMQFKYTLVSQLINPLAPGFSASVEHAAAYSIYLNGENALAILGAKTGNSCAKDSQFQVCSRR